MFNVKKQYSTHPETGGQEEIFGSVSLERVIGKDVSGAEILEHRVFLTGETDIPDEFLSKATIERYEAGEAHICSLIERTSVDNPDEEPDGEGDGDKPNPFAGQ